MIYTTLLFVHLIGVVVWVGGMFVLHFAVRPAAVAQLPPPQRLPLLASVLGRFFFWVSIAIVAILASGIGLILGAGGFGNAHVSVHLMFAIGLAMMAIFLHIRFAPFLAAAARGRGDATGRRRRRTSTRSASWWLTNLVLGIVTTAVATIGRSLL